MTFSSSARSPRTRHGRTLALLGLVAACAGTSKPAGVGVPTGETSGGKTSGTVTVLPDMPDMRAREDLPEAVRELLTARMDRHSEEMTSLMLSVVMLDYELVRTYADKFAQEPSLGRPLPGETGTVNEMLPRAFFVQQDAMKESSRSLSHAAKMRDDQQLIRAFADLTRSCIGCHAVYRFADFDSFDHDEPKDQYPCKDGDSCGDEEEDD